MSDLPEFKSRKYTDVMSIVSRALNPGSGRGNVQRLVEYEDGHYRVIFSPDYFVLTEGAREPSKSQWNTLKKRLKRLDRQIFVFKVHGQTSCATQPASSETKCYYIDFGFFAY